MMQKVHFRLTSVAQKRFSLSSLLGSSIKDIFERRTSTGSGHFATVGKRFGSNVRANNLNANKDTFFFFKKTLSKTNLAASRHNKREKASLSVECVVQKFLCWSLLLCLVLEKHLIRLGEYRDSRETKITW